MLICIDPGHGGPDPGAVAGGIEEEDLTLDVSLKAAKLLVDSGHEVFLTRTLDEKVDNQRRCDIANDRGADIFVAVHFNAAKRSSAKGHEVIYCPYSTEGKKLAKSIHDVMSEALELKPRGVKTDTATGRGPFKVLRGTKMPAVIVECLFISNPENLAKADEEKERLEIAMALVEGIINYGGAKMSDEKEVLSSWEELQEIFEDGKLEPSEAPILVEALITVVDLIAGVLTAAKVDPKIGLILTMIVGVLKMFGEALENELENINKAWAEIMSTLNDDDKISLNEIPTLLSGLGSLTEITIRIMLPFLTEDFLKKFGVIGEKLGRVNKWLGWLAMLSGKVKRRVPIGGGLV